MTGYVPPTIQSPKTVIGVGTRELIILGGGLLVAILVILSPLGLIAKVGLAALVVGVCALLALGRAPTSGKTFEEYFLDMLRFYTRGRFLQRGTGEVRQAPKAPEKPAYPAADVGRVFEKQAARGIVKMVPLPLSWGGFFGVLSFTFLVVLLVWIWTGGLQELLLRFGVGY